MMSTESSKPTRPPDEAGFVIARSKATGRSISALIRDAVSRTYGSRRDADADLRAIDAARGAWDEREVDGEAYVEHLRSGDRPGEAVAR